VTEWELSRPDWVDRLKAGRSLLPALPHLNRRAGDRAVAVFKKLRLADVDGTPTLGEACGEWFFEIVRAVFGSADPTTRLRMITELFLLVTKKNSKTTYGALMVLTALLLNERPRAQIALMAPVQDTAEEAFNAAAGAIALDPVLEKKFHVRDHQKTIVHRETKAELQIMTFDPEVLTGKKFAFTLIDEVHVIAKNSKASKAIRQVRGGMVPFWEAFLVFITSMPDDEAPIGVMKTELTKAREIRDGKRHGKMLSVLYEFPREMQLEKAVWMTRRTGRW
jgi:phage terminase large subunit-like protein